jgi:uncharacterized protein (TIGR03437 family)
MNKIVRLLAVSAASLVAQSVTINPTPTREFGHPLLPPSSSPFQFNSQKENYVEGRELSSPFGIAIDNSSSPPIVYVADTFNNRVLVWKNSTIISKTNFADRVIGQKDLFTTNGGGPGTSQSTGLFLPAAVAVDTKGNLYVADEGNNRILRYPKPLSQTSDQIQPDMVIGQKTFSSLGTANEGSPIPSSKSLAFYTYQFSTLAMTFDAQGNLWVTDALNNRVLQFPAGALAAGSSEPSAAVVLGQLSFTTSQLPSNFTQRSKDGIQGPGGLAFDNAGRLYVADSVARVLQYVANPTTGTTASRILGVAQIQPGQTVITYPTQYTLGSPNGGSPNGLFTIGNNLFVMDTPQNRIVRYDVPENWSVESASTFSPQQATVIGQPDGFNSGKPNHGASDPDGYAFQVPCAAAVVNSTAEIWVADTGNNRVIALPATGNQLYTAPATKLLGQLDYNYNGSNLVEGRELFLKSGNAAGGGVAIDKNSNPPHLYVADTFNNRILGFADARKVGTDSRNVLTQRADIVIGQPDLFHSSVNYPNSDATKTSDEGLSLPNGLALDANGNLFVADSGNSRVLRFPAPFSQAAGAVQHANLVLGQSSFTSQKISDPSSNNMNFPFGVALLSDGTLVASDSAHNRILLFRKPGGGDFSNGQAAGTVLGQSNFSSITTGSGNSQLNTPRNIAVDTSDRLYVTDPGNNRMLVFTNATGNGNGAQSAYQLNQLSNPQGVAVSTATGEIWLALAGTAQVLRYPEFQTLQLNGPNATATLAAAAPTTVTLDPFDNPVVLEATNRMTFYFGQATFQHVANYNQQPMAPGMLAYLYRNGKPFDLQSNNATAYPWPTSLSDIQVTVNGIPAPLFNVGVAPGRIDFQVPYDAPCGCNGEPASADFVVTKVSTGQVLAAATLPMAQASPGFFTKGSTGVGQVAAVNDDGTVNDSNNAIGRGKVISFYLTGLGRVPGHPPDGMPASGAISGPVPPTVIINGTILSGSAVSYSGLTGFPGGWQINATVPANANPVPAVPVGLTIYDIRANVGPNGNIVNTIAVK